MPAVKTKKTDAQRQANSASKKKKQHNKLNCLQIRIT